jgi:uncharacterized protein YndB with AHSA1/START domain
MAHEVRITRKIAATPDEVYDAWTDPKSVVEWMIPIPGGSTRAKLDPRVGGRFHIDMTAEGKTYPHEGEYLRLERARLIEFTWISSATNQQRSVVRVELRPIGNDETELTLTHKQLPTEKSKQEHHDGWSAILDRLGKVLMTNNHQRREKR